MSCHILGFPEGKIRKSFPFTVKDLTSSLVTARSAAAYLAHQRSSLGPLYYVNTGQAVPLRGVQVPKILHV